MALQEKYIEWEVVRYDGQTRQIVIQFKDDAQSALDGVTKGWTCPRCWEPYAGTKCDTCS